MEDTTFATFVVGVGFGFLSWYWLRRLTRNLGSDEDILPSWLRPWRSIRGIEILVSILLVIGLLWLSVILLGVPETRLPQWIPHRRYLHDLVTREPIGHCFLGFLFGLLLGEWLSYIFLPPQLRTDALRDSHTRWGYFLVGIVALGLLYPLLLPVLRTLKGGDVKTPVGSLSFGVKEPERGANIQGVATQGVPPAAHSDQLIDKIGR